MPRRGLFSAQTGLATAAQEKGLAQAPALRLNLTANQQAFGLYLAATVPEQAQVTEPVFSVGVNVTVEPVISALAGAA